MKIVEYYKDYGDQVIISIVEANYLGNFRISLKFDNGKEHVINFKPFLDNARHATIKKYLEEPQFILFKIVDGNLDWNDYEMCFSIQTLYDNTLIAANKPARTKRAG